MASRKPPKRLFKNQDVVHTYQHERETKFGMKEMTRDHGELLDYIEGTLVSYARDFPNSDDRAVDEALSIALRGRGPDEDEADTVVELYEMLESMREYRHDVPDNVWRAGLKTVRDYVRRHSTLTPGDESYLCFVEQSMK